MATPHWNLDDNCPPAIAALDEADLRERAVRCANDALDAGRHPIRALSEGIARAFAAADRAAQVSAEGAAWFVCTDHDGTFVVSREDGAVDELRFDAYEDALFRGSELAREDDTALYVTLEGNGVLGKWEFFDDRPGDNAIHVMPSGDKWVLRTVTEPDIGSFATKREAVRTARERARERELDLVTHYKEGRVQRVTHHARDAA